MFVPIRTVEDAGKYVGYGAKLAPTANEEDIDLRPRAIGKDPEGNIVLEDETGITPIDEVFLNAKRDVEQTLWVRANNS